jgi:peptide/nickel transport system permease protein
MPSGLARFVARRALFAAALVLIVSSAALVLASLAPPDRGFDHNLAAVAAERVRLGLDRPIHEQYFAWLGRAVRLDLGQSLRFGRPVTSLIRERAGNTALLGLAALALATLIGIPLGVFTGSRPRGPLVSLTRGVSALLLAVPPLITSLVLLLLAVRTGWLPTGGLPETSGADAFTALVITARHLLLPTLALALPIAASLERLQSSAMREALADPSIAAARARGIPPARLTWSHAWRLSLKPVLAIYGIVVGSVLSGSFAVEIVTAWPGLGELTYEALRARDLYLVAGCAAAGAGFLAAGILASDLALAAADPRIEEPA